MRLLFVILLVFPFSLLSQKTKEIVVKFTNSKQVKEKYFVLKSDRSIKHGVYVSYHEETNKWDWDKNVESIGNYVNGQKDGLWTVNMEKGYYKDGLRVGIWKTYDDKGKVVSQFDFDSGQEIEMETPNVVQSVVED